MSLCYPKIYALSDKSSLDNFFSTKCKFFPFVSCKMKMANNRPIAQTHAQNHSVVYSP